jgi:hypothetical protein
MTFRGRTGGTAFRLSALTLALALASGGCRASDPVLTFLDDESGLSFTHPPRWIIGFAEQAGVRYRYLTAPKVGEDKEALSVTLISPTTAASADNLAQAYLTGAVGVVRTPDKTGGAAWTFKDAEGVPSRLRVVPAEGGRFFGAWARGSEAAMERYAGRLDVLMDSLRVENPAAWPEERFAGMAARAPQTWTRGSRLSNATNATMQFKSPPLFVEKATDTVHGFATLSKEPVPPPGDLEAFAKMVKGRDSDTVALLEHRPWPAAVGSTRPGGYVDYMRSGTPLTSTRIRRWITVTGGVGLVFACEARADAYDRLDPWCRRVAETVRLEPQAP